MAYLLDHAWLTEEERLSILARALDPGSTRRLAALGVTAGWRCLEVGAGGGSIAAWLCEQVGPAGHVVATDLETAFVEAIGAPNLEVRRHNILVDDLEHGAFDLVHCRAVLEHFTPPDRHTALAKMVAALKPGGWMLIEDGDTLTFLPTSPRGADLFLRCSRQFARFFASGGGDPEYGRQLRADLLAHGLSSVTMDGYVFEWGGESPETLIWLYIYHRWSEQVVAAELLSEDEIAAFLDLIQSPDFRALSPLAMAAWGQKQP